MSLCKPIEQYDLEGNLINRYIRIKEALRQTHIDEKKHYPDSQEYVQAME
jgi:hypothetical protein